MAALTLLAAVLFAIRAALALAYARRRYDGNAKTAAILQPILSGDPALAATLAANAENLPEHHFYWLVDDDDPVGLAAARAAAILQPILSGDPALAATLAANAKNLPEHHFYWLVDDDDPAGQAAARAAAILQPILSGDPALAATLAANAKNLPEHHFHWLVDDDDPAGQAAAGAAAILQPILSGDPALAATLAANAKNLPEHHFYWLVDDDDPAGQAAARAAAGPNVRLVSGPGPLDGENPKTAKLVRALELVTEEFVVVLDDDTRIGPAALARLLAALDHAALVTGLPVFVANGTVFERFVGGFVNGNAMLTYLPAAAIGAQHTINGMIYAMRRAELHELGGFDVIRGHLTDDYAMAQLYEKNGRRVLQTAIPAHVGMTIADAAHCARVLRRWFLFANRYMRENAHISLLFLVALPSVLPLAGLYFGWQWLVVLFMQAALNRLLLWRITGHTSGPADVLFEVLAGVFTPFFYVSALFWPNRLRWRSRRIAMDGGRIRYK